MEAVAVVEAELEVAEAEVAGVVVVGVVVVGVGVEAGEAEVVRRC